MAAKAFLAGLLCMTLPETKGKPTEETMDGDARMAADNVVAMDELCDDEKKPAGQGSEEKKKDEEKNVEQVQPQNNKHTLNGDARMAADNVVAVDELGDDENVQHDKEKNVDESKLRDNNQTKDQNTEGPDEIGVENTAF
jgi:hypothetical protein